MTASSPAPPATTPPSEVALDVFGLTRRFGARVAVDDLELHVKAGDVYGFLGPNGAGKTTAMRCMLGLIQRNRGDVRIFGSSDLVAARSHVGAIIETPAFHPWISGRNNLRIACAYANIPRSEWDTNIDRLLGMVGLSDRGGDRAGTYSLGMKQRLGIARALLGQPSLLMLDEPTNGLDPKGMREIRELIRSLAQNDQITIFISSHLLSEVQAICNRVGIIQHGRLRAEGTVKELLEEHTGSGRVEIGTTQRELLETTLASMEEVTLVGPGEAGRWVVDLGGAEIADINRRLVEAGVSVDALVPLTTSLEDVFLEVTR